MVDLDFKYSSYIVYRKNRASTPNIKALSAINAISLKEAAAVSIIARDDSLLSGHTMQVALKSVVRKPLSTLKYEKWHFP